MQKLTFKFTDKKTGVTTTASAPVPELFGFQLVRIGAILLVIDLIRVCGIKEAVSIAKRSNEVFRNQEPC